MPVLNPESLVEERVRALRDFHADSGQARAELDVSGGVDSAVMLNLLVRALGPDRVTAVFIGIQSSTMALQRAREVASAAGAKLLVDELDDTFQQRVATMIDRLVEAGHRRVDIQARLERDPTILGSIRSCLRAPIGRGYNRLSGGGIRHGTGNECEDRFVRFYQKGGDGEVDTNPLGFLSKGEVYQLARALGVPRAVIDAAPSPDLWASGDQHTDEVELERWTGIAWSYSRIDAESGAYCRVGTIERVNRYLDDIDDALFRPEVTLDDLLDGQVYAAAVGHQAFGAMPRGEIRQLLASARQLEQRTRHKANPNIPTLGTRAALIRAGLLSNTLPQV